MFQRAGAGLVGERRAVSRPSRGHIAACVRWPTCSTAARNACTWSGPIAGDLDQRSARLLSKTGQPLAIPVAVTERETDGRRVVAADLNLAPLSAGDYVIELTVGRGATSEVRLVAFRVMN